MNLTVLTLFNMHCYVNRIIVMFYNAVEENYALIVGILWFNF